MAKYSTVRNALEMFSVQLGLDDESAVKMVRRSLQNETWRASLEDELRRLVFDPAAPWRDLVANEAYEIDEPESSEEAREVVLSAIWNIVFPEEAPPSPGTVLAQSSKTESK